MDDEEQRREPINIWQQLAQRYPAFPFSEKLRDQTADFDERQKQLFYQTLIVYLAAAAGLPPDQLTEVIAAARDATIELATGEMLADSSLSTPTRLAPAHDFDPALLSCIGCHGHSLTPRGKVVQCDDCGIVCARYNDEMRCFISCCSEPPPKGNEPDVDGRDAELKTDPLSGKISHPLTKPILLAGNCESFHKEMEELVERIQQKFNIAPNSSDVIRTLQRDQAARGYVKAQLSPTQGGWSVRDSSELSHRAFIVRDCKTRTEAIEAGKRWVAEAPDRRGLIAWPCDMELPEENPYGNPALLTNLYRREWELSRVDFRTGALNSRAFMEILGEASHSRRHPRPMTLVCVDLDDFKRINDVLGHNTGHYVLKVVARTMQCTLREVDFVARLGGDEFAVLLPETGAEDVPLVLDRLQKALTAAMVANKWAVTFSIGAVTFRTPLASADDMVHEADKVMYSAKQSGKNRVVHVVFN